MTAYVYNPDDEDDVQSYAGIDYVLKANSATAIVSQEAGVSDEYVADHIVTKQEQWGFVRVNGPVKDGKASVKSDQDIVDAAELKYLEATKAWAEGLIVEDAKKRKPYTDAGLTGPREGEDVVKARGWLKKYDKKLRDAKLV